MGWDGRDGTDCMGSITVTPRTTKGWLAGHEQANELTRRWDQDQDEVNKTPGPRPRCDKRPHRSESD